MKLAKRILLFMSVNILIVVTISTVLSLLGVQPYLSSKGINYEALMIFCAIWGFGGAGLSLALSRLIAKWTMGVNVVDSSVEDPQLQFLVERVHYLSRRAGLSTMPEVGVYESSEINAFATGPTKNRSLVAVSSGLLDRLNSHEVEGVLAHEVAHIANGDMVTMTLVQGVVNAFVMFLSRVIAFFASQLVDEEKRSVLQWVVTVVLELLLGILGMIVVAGFSRHREYRADQGGAELSGSHKMIAALEKLRSHYGTDEVAVDSQSAVAALKISGKAGGLLKLFATHPDLEDRIQRLRDHHGSWKSI